MDKIIIINTTPLILPTKTDATGRIKQKAVIGMEISVNRILFLMNQ